MRNTAVWKADVWSVAPSSNQEKVSFSNGWFSLCCFTTTFGHFFCPRIVCLPDMHNTCSVAWLSQSRAIYSCTMLHVQAWTRCHKILLPRLPTSFCANRWNAQDPNIQARPARGQVGYSSRNAFWVDIGRRNRLGNNPINNSVYTYWVFHGVGQKLQGSDVVFVWGSCLRKRISVAKICVSCGKLFLDRVSKLVLFHSPLSLTP